MPAMSTLKRAALALTFVLVLVAPAFALAPGDDRLSFPAPEHRWMQVEVTFPEVPDGTLEVRMSRTSPGRYALHEFAKNVFDVSVTNGAGAALVPSRPNLHQWNVDGHDGTVVVRYRVFGDRTDGTYLSVDAEHAHLNMPAALMWARSFDDRPARVTFVPPLARAGGSRWRVATQLFPTPEPYVFTAPNLPYLLDSPAELSDFTLRTFQVTDDRGTSVEFRIALHHDGTGAEADAYARDVETIVRETLAVFGGEFPAFETGTYTFIADYLPWASGDGMEHRNSTILTSPGALRNPAQRAGILGTVAHEFVHAWNVERIRPRSLEPFDFEDASVATELWFGEGFTSYYDDLILHRAGLATLESTLASFANAINAVELGPGRRFRSVEEMSQLAAFVDAAVSVDRTAWPNTFISYYTWGAVLGLGLDLELRSRSNILSLDTLMQAMWAAYGRPGQLTPGRVGTPYTIDGLRFELSEQIGRPFVQDFFGRYVQGRETIDFRPLMARAGLVVRPQAPGRAWPGAVALDASAAGARVTSLVPFGSPLYDAGVAQDDRIVSIDDVAIDSQKTLTDVLGRLTPGTSVRLLFVRRGGESVVAMLTPVEDPRIEIVPLEGTGGTLSDAQRAFRAAWLGSRQSQPGR
jgi:predicted metalloprotease with PDZ domain